MSSREHYQNVLSQHQHTLQTVQEFDEKISTLEKQLEEVRRKRKTAKGIEEQIYEEVKKAKRMQPEYRETRTSPEILCDILKFLSKNDANKCQRVCWWWNEVIRDAEDILPRKYICYLVFERYPRWHDLHYDGKYSYSSPWCTGYTAFDCSWCEGTGFFMMAKAHFGRFTLEFSDFYEAIPKLHGIVKENQQPVSVSRFVSNPWAEPEKLPTFKDLPTFASFLEVLFEGLIIADNMELGFRTAACIRSEDLMRIAKIPVKMKWEFRKDPEENISDEEILELIKEMKRFGNKYTLHIRGQNPENFHHFLYENFGSLNGLDKKFSAKIHFNYYSIGIMDDDKEQEIAEFTKSLPKVQIEEYEKPFDRKHTIRRTHYNFIQDDVLFQVREGEHSFGLLYHQTCGVSQIQEEKCLIKRVFLFMLYIFDIFIFV